MIDGTVKWFDRRKGYGFISYEGASADVFVHYTGFAREGTKLMEGDEVCFEITAGEKGPRADNVTLKSSEDLQEADTTEAQS